MLGCLGLRTKVTQSISLSWAYKSPSGRMDGWVAGLVCVKNNRSTVVLLMLSLMSPLLVYYYVKFHLLCKNQLYFRYLQIALVWNQNQSEPTYTLGNAVSFCYLLFYIFDLILFVFISKLLVFPVHLPLLAIISSKTIIVILHFITFLWWLNVFAVHKKN